jgi:hypothetical protein
VTSKYVFLPWQKKFEISYILAKLMPERELPNKHALYLGRTFQESESLGAIEEK